MSRQLLQRTFFVLRPPLKPARGQAFLAQPEPLTIIHEHFDGRGPLITKNKNVTGKWIGRQNLAAYLRQAVYAFSKIRWLHSQKDAHVGGNLDHDRNDLSTPSISGKRP